MTLAASTTSTPQLTTAPAYGIYDKCNQVTSIQFLDYVLEKLPFRVEVIQTDNGAEFQSLLHYHILDRGIRRVYIRPARQDSTAK